ncbi:mas-related G-protein coupled receptor member X1-like [Gracilinanus agilis]|uniref:mas-related G-protein coupled receptor member X1-like n=1 Tax=Gracilinanus agilis TaxID=191870 RepID=UPI001CFF1D98|nr:mas-related G-protein coupled receptor member X1-like [Gracilinanus agilis]
MSVSPTSEQQESVLDITVQMSTKSSLEPVAEAHRALALFYMMETLSLVFALVGLVGNSIVLWLLGFRIQRSPFSVYILNLAASDALFLGNCFVLCMWEVFGDTKAPVLVLWSCIQHMSHSVGLSLLAVISTERCLSGLFPIWYRCHRPKHMSTAVCAALWVLSGLLWGAVAVLRFLRKLYIFHLALQCVHFGWFVLLTCVLCVSSLILVLRIQCRSQCGSQHRRPPRLYLLILLTLVFLIFGLPFGIIHAIRLFSGSVLIPYGLPRLLACVNSSANPFIYFFLGSQWRRRGREPLRVVLQRALEEERVEGVELTDISDPNTLDKLS